MFHEALSTLLNDWGFKSYNIWDNENLKNELLCYLHAIIMKTRNCKLDKCHTWVSRWKRNSRHGKCVCTLCNFKGLLALEYSDNTINGTHVLKFF